MTIDKNNIKRKLLANISWECTKPEKVPAQV